ncbi:MAG: DMT family transporter [Lachnospiraceae bacterium]|nr:DMT family transporter [Lachnospiraceae bacterium]
MGMILALISGTLMSIQGVFNTEVSKESGQWVTNTFVQFTGFLVCLLIWFVSERTKHGFLELFLVEKRYMLFGGVIGSFITFTVICSMAGLGPAKAALFIVVSQILAAYLIELFGIFGVERSPFLWRKLFGTILAAGGIILFQWET